MKKKALTVAEAGRLGGKKILKKYGKSHMKALSKKANSIRWSKDEKLSDNK